jgi:hypothetical protein
MPISQLGIIFTCTYRVLQHQITPFNPLEVLYGKEVFTQLQAQPQCKIMWLGQVHGRGGHVEVPRLVLAIIGFAVSISLHFSFTTPVPSILYISPFVCTSTVHSE